LFLIEVWQFMRIVHLPATEISTAAGREKENHRIISSYQPCRQAEQLTLSSQIGTAGLKSAKKQRHADSFISKRKDMI